MPEKKSRYTPAQNRATQKYHAEHMEEIKFRAQKSERLNDLINAAAQRCGTAKAEYMKRAITDRLTADGVTLESLDN